ncbi:MAG: FAD-dependent oxidoreductase [Clostridiales bacterium]|nr:FAD-dependent oxidoreductase [Clostridiales bacterium]
MNYDVAIIGGGLGGLNAAVVAAKHGCKVLLTEEYDRVGGQLTSQAVPPDEHAFIESTGCTASYRAYRNAVRDFYRAHPHIIDRLKTQKEFCPGGSSVSRLAHPPALAQKLLDARLQPYIESGAIELRLCCKPVAARRENGRICSVAFSHGAEARAAIFIDATETGDLLALSGAGYVTGAESRAQTGETLAPAKACPADMQPVTWVAACDWQNGEAPVIERPAEYGYFRRYRMPYDDYNVLGMRGPDSRTGKSKPFGFFNGETCGNEKLFGLFSYRRIVCAEHFRNNAEPRDVTLINWPQNDYFMANIFGTDDDAHHRYMARQLTLSLVYWLQTEGGYKGLGLRTDVLGTPDGLAAAPYIRESRRMRALTTITANDVTGGRTYAHSVGIGHYHIDLHITTVSHTFLFCPAKPFEIPFGALVSADTENLMAGCKNIGTTHLTNGCYRTHPVEWNIGEAAGAAAAYCVRCGILPEQLEKDEKHFAQYATLLRDEGIAAHWEKRIIS